MSSISNMIILKFCIRTRKNGLMRFYSKIITNIFRIFRDFVLVVPIFLKNKKNIFILYIMYSNTPFGSRPTGQKKSLFGRDSNITFNTLGQGSAYTRPFGPKPTNVPQPFVSGIGERFKSFSKGLFGQQPQPIKRSRSRSPPKPRSRSPPKSNRIQRSNVIGCPSFGLDPLPIDHENTFRYQSSIFHPDRNKDCVDYATGKFKILNNSRKNIIGGKSKKNVRKHKKRSTIKKHD